MNNRSTIMKLVFAKNHSLLMIIIVAFSVSYLAGVKQFDFNQWQGNYTIKGKNAFDQFGYQVASGDINGDGRDDVIISSPSADPLGRNSAGEVYIFWGTNQSEQNVSLNLNTDAADVTIYGAFSGDKLGYSVAVGSVNGDSYADFALAAPYSNAENSLQAGKVYLFYGESNFPAIIDLNSYSADHVFVGEEANDFLGQSLLFTDLNNDNKAELIMGAPFANKQEVLNCGKVYLIWSQETYPPIINLATTDNLTYISGNSINANLGSTLVSTNINNDQFQDLIIGCPGYDDGALVNNGRVYVIKGRTFFPYNEIITANSTYINYQIKGSFHSSLLGKALAAGDVNGDGFGDLLLTDFSNEASSNKLYLLYGSNSLEGEISLSSANASSTILHPSIESNKFGEKVLIANLKSDTPADIIIASPEADSDNGSASGLVHILYGRNEFATSYDLDLGEYDELYQGESPNAKLGSAVNVADFNNDQKQDIWLGASEAGNNKGKAYSVFGGIPWVWNLLPLDGATNVDIDQAIAFSLADDQQVDLNSINVNIAGSNYDLNSGNLSYSGSGNFYRVTIAPENYFGYNQIINVTIDANDNDGWHIPTTNYRFFTREDTDPPFTNQWNPAPNEQGVPVDTNIEFNVYDLGEGVNISSLVVNINEINYYSGNPYFSYLGEANNYRIIINPPTNFAFGEEVFVAIACKDLAPNPNVMSTFTYSFICGQDNSAPSIIIIEPAYGEEVARTNPIFVEVADSESSLNQSSLVFTLDGVDLLPQSVISTIANGRLRVLYNPLEHQLLTYGEKEIYFYIEDASTNSNSIDTVSVFTVIPDNQAPYTTNHFPAKLSSENPTNTLFKVDVLDLLSGVDITSISILINNVEIMGSGSVIINNLNNGYRIIYNPPSRLVGEVTVRIQVSDLESPANTMPAETYTFSTSLDTEAPYLTDLSPAEGALNVPIEANLTFKIFDSKTGVDRTSLQVIIDDIDVTANLNIAPITKGFDVLYLIDCPYEFDQLVNVQITCSDLELPANAYENSYTFRTTPDLIPPELVNFNPEPNAVAVPIDTNISFEIWDNGLGVDISTLVMKVNNEIVEPETTLIPETMFYQVNYVGASFAYGETVSIVVSVSDLASSPNTLTNFNYSFTVVDDDRQPPFFSAFNPAPESTNIPVATSISLLILDSESTVNPNSLIFKVNNLTVPDYDLQPVTNNDGSGFRLTYYPPEVFGFGEIVRIQIYAMDTSSNNNAANYSYSFTTESDTQAPYLEIATPSDGGEGYANSILYLSLKDDLSGIDQASFSLKINGNFVTTYQDSLRDNRLEVWYSTAGFFAVETVLVEFYLADMVGNICNESYSFSIIPDTFPPYYLLLKPALNGDIAINDYLQIAILDKGVGIAEESISFQVNGKLIENYQLDKSTYNNNPDSLGFILRYQVDDTYYAGQNLSLFLTAKDKNQPQALESQQSFNLFIKRDLTRDKVEVIPNIISLNFDGINDSSRIIIPTNKQVSCKIFTRKGKEIADLATSPYIAEESGGNYEYQVAVWDGKNKDKKAVNAGIYICQVKYGDKIHRNTITVAK